MVTTRCLFVSAGAADGPRKKKKKNNPAEKRKEEAKRREIRGGTGEESQRCVFSMLLM